MGATRFIGDKIRFKGKIASACVTLSFFVMIIAVAVSSGFRHEIRSALSEVSGDIRLIPLNQDFISEESSIGASPAYLERLSQMPMVEKVSPVIYRAGIIKSGENIHGVMFKGVEKGEDFPELGVCIPSRLATMLSLKEGDSFLSYFIGENVKARKFTVAQIYDSVVDSPDKLTVMVSIQDMRRLNGWEEDQISAFEIALTPSYRSPERMNQAEQEIGYLVSELQSDLDESVYAQSLVSSYPQLFDWLGLIDSNVAFILVLMTIVAGFNMISGLLILLFENISTIGLLKALGMTDRGVGKVFLYSSSTLVLKGMLAGNLAAILFILVQGSTHLLKLDPTNYFVSFVPVHLDVPFILTTDIVSFALIMVLLLIPTLFISKVDPADTVRVG
ncbi:MAG: FtsX-like permease family protein [Bacteroidales bacterium]|nr:FtsX-like permease family protein [Bacteroidales bacterium]